MKKVFTLIAMAMLCVVGASAQTEKAILAWGNVTASSPKNQTDSKGNMIPELLTGKEEQNKGFSILLNKDSKGYASGNKIKATVDETNYEYTTIKCSNGADNILNLPQGIKTKKITFVSYQNYNLADKGNVPGRTSYWKQVGDTKYTADDAAILNCYIEKKDGKNFIYTSGFDVQSFDIEATESIIFTQTGEQTCFFIIVEYTKNTNSTATINTYGYSTFASDKALDFTGIEGLTAYTAKVSGDVVALTPVTKVAAGTGLVLKGEGGKTYEIPGTTVEGKTESDLKAAVTETTPETEGVVNYVLSNIDDVTGFYRFDGTTIPAGKAYLQVSAAQAAKGFKMVFGDATGISNVNAGKAANADNAYYTLSGIRTEAPVKGLYIRNGKKIIVK